MMRRRSVSTSSRSSTSPRSTSCRSPTGRRGRCGDRSRRRRASQARRGQQELADREVASPGDSSPAIRRPRRAQPGARAHRGTAVPSPSRTTPSPWTERSVMRVRSSTAPSPLITSEPSTRATELHDLSESAPFVALEHGVAADLQLSPCREACSSKRLPWTDVASGGSTPRSSAAAPETRRLL